MVGVALFAAPLDAHAQSEAAQGEVERSEEAQAEAAQAEAPTPPLHISTITDDPEHAATQHEAREDTAKVRSNGDPQVPAEQPKPRKNLLVPANTEHTPNASPPDYEAQAQEAENDRRWGHAHCSHCVRRVSLVLGGNAGFGLPAKASALESNTKQVVSGLSFAPPGLFLSVAIPLNRRWDLMPRFAAQLVWGGDKLTLAQSVEVRARVFPGAPKRRWEEFFVLGVGYGELHHLVHETTLAEDDTTATRELESAPAGPFRILSGMGARWNGSHRIAVEVEVTPYILLPNWSVHVELAAGLAIKL